MEREDECGRRRRPAPHARRQQRHELTVRGVAAAADEERPRLRVAGRRRPARGLHEGRQVGSAELDGSRRTHARCGARAAAAGSRARPCWPSPRRACGIPGPGMSAAPLRCPDMKKIGFLSFGHWGATRGSQTRSASDALLQSIDLAVAAEELGADGAYFRVHHFASQLASPFPLLAAVGARTSRIEIGTGVIDMRYENPLYMAEDAGAADLISGGRLQLGISRGSPEQVIEGYRYFGYEPGRGLRPRRHGPRAHPGLPRRDPRARASPSPTRGRCSPTRPACCGSSRTPPGLRDRIWWGAGTRATAEWTAEQGMNLMSSTLLTEDTGVPFHQLQAEQIQRFRDAWKAAGHDARAAGLGQPQHLPDRQRPRPRLLRPRGHAARTRSATSTAASRASARRTPASPTSWSRSSPRTRRSPPPTRCC